MTFVQWYTTEEARKVTEVSGSFTTKEIGAKKGKGQKSLGFTDQLPILLNRTFICYLRDPTVYLPRVALYMNMSFFFGIAYSNIGWQDPLKQSDIFNRMFLWNWITAFMSYMGK